MSSKELLVLQHELTIERMNKDREFSLFLDENDKDMSEDFDHPNWNVYRNMLDEYTSLNASLALVNYYSKTNV